MKTQSKGVGSELLHILKWMKWVIPASCTCRNTARDWDNLGVGWCDLHIEDELLPKLREQAHRFSLPFPTPFVSKLVRMAISRARKGGARK